MGFFVESKYNKNSKHLDKFLTMLFKKIDERLNKKFSLPTTLIILYLAMLTLCIALYALIQIYVDDKSTATNLMIWSATLFAPVAVFYGFYTWKIQLFDQSKIKAIEKLKEKVSEFSKITFNYRFYSRNLDLLRNRNSNEFDKLEKAWVQKAESLRRDIMTILEIDGFYFENGTDELSKLYELNNGLLDLIIDIENASSVLKMCWIGSATPSPLSEGETVEILISKSQYLLDPSDHFLNFELDRNVDLKSLCRDLENEMINNRIKDFFKFLNELLNSVFIK